MVVCQYTLGIVVMTDLNQFLIFLQGQSEIVLIMLWMAIWIGLGSGVTYLYMSWRYYYGIQYQKRHEGLVDTYTKWQQDE